MKKPRANLSSIGWVLLGSVVLAGILYIGFIIYVSTIRSASPAVPTFSTPVITIIPAPSLTPVIRIPTTTQTTQTSTPQGPVQEGGISVGIYVKISGTNGEGLNLRTAPGTTTPIRFLGMDAEVFLVKDGPKQVDNIVWWYLQAPYDDTRNGWAAANYLTVIQTP